MSINRDNLSIRLARDTDTQQLLEIYDPFIKDTAVSFEYEFKNLTLIS